MSATDPLRSVNHQESNFGMNSPSISPYDADRLKKWRIAHVLALFVALFIAVALVANFTSLFETTSPPDLLGVPIAISFFWLWGWMICDLYQNGVPTNKTAWWFLLIGLMYFGVLMYFFSIWRPRNRPFTD
jgi:phosphatidylserine synthase